MGAAAHQVAVIGWGSLIWSAERLRVDSRWRRDGPRLPVEFARISQDGRLTLVIEPSSPEQTTYWALSGLRTLDEARENLRLRERATSPSAIHYLERFGDGSATIPNLVEERVRRWLGEHAELKAAIWTGLASNWELIRGAGFTPEQGVSYLEHLSGDAYERAKEYVTNAPPQIQTAVRKLMREHGWIDAELPAALFEEHVR